ncbi:hypothetical protein BDQ17DRAFT_1377712 [Cyathus striatus]|nr:hypothetical protein BDQ17DRAFT_1377712 [Cyathus striatus]
MNNQQGGRPHFRNELNRATQLPYGYRIEFQDNYVGPQNDPTWTSICMIDDVEYARESGPNKSTAREGGL